MIRVHLKIYGKVQGVFFRDHTCKKAKEIGDITGWVANNADGTVDVVAEGPDNKIYDFVDCCQSGPSTSHVEKMEAEKLTYTGEFDSFDIRY